eukprot:scaffold193813_cov26-Tisochrysis_lutea.AAC.1
MAATSSAHCALLGAFPPCFPVEKLTLLSIGHSLHDGSGSYAKSLSNAWGPGLSCHSHMDSSQGIRPRVVDQ